MADLPRTRRTLLVATVALCAWLAAGHSPVSVPGPPGAPGLAPHVAGQILVKFREPARPSQRRAAAAEVGAHTARRLFRGIEKMSLRPGRSVEAALERLRRHPLVEFAEPNYLFRIETLPDDVRFEDQWSLDNSGQTEGLPGSDINAREAWLQSTGSHDVLAAVIDTGVDLTHPDLAANLWTNPGEIPANGIDDDGNGFVDDVRGWNFVTGSPNPSDDNGHGTHVSGILGAVGNNGLGIAGVAWKVTLLPVKWLDAEGIGEVAHASQALLYAAAQGTRLVNGSFVGPESMTLREAIDEVREEGVLFVVAAGNSGLNVDRFQVYPTAYDSDNIVSVTATDDTDRRASFGNTGPMHVDLAAPGVSILSTTPGAAYTRLSGTSMSAPHVAGVAALLLAVAPDLPMATLRDTLLQSVDPIPDLQGTTVTGGRINAGAALASVDRIPPAPVGDLSVTGAASNSVMLAWTASGDDGRAGQALAYDLRYSTGPLDETSFAVAAPAPAPRPGPAGSMETVEVLGLEGSTVYTFALRAVDDWGNPGPISNLATGVTLSPPSASSGPPSVDIALLTGQSDSAVLVVRNDGPGTLDWSARPAVLLGPGGQGAPGALTIDPGSSRLLPAGAEEAILLSLDATGLAGGLYQAAVELETNDPAAPLLTHSVRLEVTDAADMVVRGLDVTLQSTDSFFIDGGATIHDFPITVPVEGGATLELIADGNYRQPDETATLTAEGLVVGSVGGTGRECVEAVGTFPLDAGTASALASDGLIETEVRNDISVGVFCIDNLHTVTLRYRGPGEVLDFGELLVGESRSIPFVIDNLGTLDLVVELGFDAEGFTTPEPELVIPPFSSQQVPVTFHAAESRSFRAQLSVGGNDPDAPSAALALVGRGVTSPVAEVTPASVVTAATAGGQVIERLTLANTGGSDLRFSLDVENGGAGFLSASPLEGAVPPASTTDLTLVLDSAGLASGPHATALQVHSNDPETPVIAIPITLTVSGGPDLAAGDVLEFGTVVVGVGRERLLAVENRGNDPLTVSGVVTDRAEYTAEPESFSVAPGGTATVTVRLIPAGPGPVDGTLTVTSDDPDTPAHRVSLLGSGQDAPSITLEPAFIDAAVPEEERSTLLLTLGNAGAGPLEFTLTPGAGFLTADPSAGSVAPGAALGVSVVLDAAGVPPGSHETSLDILSNDPAAPLVQFPVRMNVIGAPVLVLPGTPVVLESAREFFASGDTTSHSLAVTLQPEEDVLLELIVDGDFGGEQEGATLSASGVPLVFAGGEGSDCTTHTGAISLPRAAFGDLVVDGALSLEVQNSGEVDVICSINRHRVRASYRTYRDRLDFGDVFLGTRSDLPLTVANHGTLPLEIALSGSGPAIVPSVDELTVAPGGEETVLIGLAPVSDGSVEGLVVLEGNDPLLPRATVAVSGTGVEPPVLNVQPSSLDVTLAPGERATRTLTVSNPGASPLEFTVGRELKGATVASSGVEGVPLDAVPRVMEQLSPSPVPLTCVVEDREAGSLYAQQFDGHAFYRYDAAADRWERLATSPVSSSIGCGAALLDGTIYTASGFNNVALGAYDIDRDRWTTIANPLQSPGANIATDGTSLYLASGTTFLRLDPDSGGAQALAGPLFPFSMRGGLRYHEGIIYGVRGEDQRSAGFYDLQEDRWSLLPPAPEPTVMGAAINPLDGELLAYGPTRGRNLYRLSLHTRTWDVTTIPFFEISLGGLGWLAQPTPAVYFIQGQIGTGFGRWVTGRLFAEAAPATASIPPGESLDLSVTFEAADLAPGVHRLDIVLRSNDPVSPEIRVAADMTVRSTPDLALGEENVSLASVVDYFESGDRTLHSLALPAAPLGEATLELILEGDFGQADETATLLVEGISLGPTRAFNDCQAFTARFRLTREQAAAIAEDGRVEAEVRNSAGVEPFCPSNRHTVGLSFAPRPLLDLGSVFVGGSGRRELVIQNHGGAPLEVTSIVSDAAPFVPDPGAFTVAPGASQPVAVTFTPEAEGSFAGKLRIDSNDPDTPRLSLDLAASGVLAPVASVDPAAIEETIQVGEQGRRTVRVTNTGGSPLEVALSVRSPEGEAAAADFLVVRSGEATLEPFDSADLEVIFLGRLAGPGVHDGEVVLATNDPFAAEIVVPARLTVESGPNIRVGGPLVTLASTREFTGEGARSVHTFLVDDFSVGSATLDVDALGDFGGPDETALVTLDGRPRGLILGQGPDCLTYSRRFPLSAAELETLFADGRLDVEVENSDAVSAFCLNNEHTVTLTHRPVLGLLDFGSVFVGNERSLGVEIENTGTETLEIPSLSSDEADVVPSVNSLSLEPGATQSISILFRPASPGTLGGSLRLSTNDPSSPVVDVPLAGRSQAAPSLAVEPATLSAILFSGGQVTQSITLSNDSPTPLEFSLEAAESGTDPFLFPDPPAGTVGPGGSVTVDVRFRAAGFAGGSYITTLRVLSNDPASPAVDILVAMVVRDAPDLQLRTGERLESIVGYRGSGDTTRHPLPVEELPLGDGELTVTVDGDYSASDQLATVWVEGDVVGNLVGSPLACQPFAVTFPLSRARIHDLAEDGIVEVVVTNSEAVQTSCTVNRHEVALEFEKAVDRLDFGGVFAGQSRSLTVEVRNGGGEVLHVTAITADRSEYVLSDSAFSLSPGAIRPVSVTFRPQGPGAVGGEIRILSTDPDTPELRLPVAGDGLEVPIALVTPGRLDEMLFEGDTSTRTLRIDNPGGGPLEFTLRLAQPVSFITLNPGSGIVPAGGSVGVTVGFDVTRLEAGRLETAITVESNDPARPTITVPVVLTIQGRPQIRLPGERIVVGSSKSFFLSGDRTAHELRLPHPPSGGGTLILTVDGDYGLPPESASLSVEGTFLGSVGGLAFDCTPGSLSASLTEAQFAALAADGLLEIQVENSPTVDPFCATNRHDVRLVYDTAPAVLDFGTVFAGTQREFAFEVGNDGTAPLLIEEITADSPAVVAFGAGTVIEPGHSAALLVAYRPSAVGSLDEPLRIRSSDPRRAEATIRLLAGSPEPPVASVAPRSVEVSLPPGDARTRTEVVRLDNAGLAPLQWSTTLLQGAPVPPPAATWVPRHKGDESLNGGGDASIARFGGPDAHGYRFRDGDEPGGPRFGWVEIRRAGAPVAIAGDDVTSGPISLGFDFPFYGQTFETLRVSTNGWLSFTEKGTFFSNPDRLPTESLSVPRNLLAPFFDDLHTGPDSSITYWGDGERFIVQHTAMDRFTPGSRLTFQVLLYRDGRIRFQYLELSGVVDSATVGIQGADGSAGLLAGYNDGYPREGLALEFAPIVPWVQAEPDAGTLAGGASTEVALRFSAADLDEGDYEGTVAFLTSDPVHPLLPVGATLHARLVALDRLQVRPAVLSRASRKGRLRLSLQLPAGLDPRQVDLSTVEVNGVPLPADVLSSINDDDRDGVEELILRMERSVVLDTLPAGEAVPLTVTGEVRGGGWFTGTLPLRVLPPR